MLKIHALLHASRFPHACSDIELLETHISWVILTGEFAYKIKKPVNLGFLDFSSLEKRRWACDEELRLNRRLAPDIYLDVVPVYGTQNAPDLKGDGKPIEYAVRMRQFPQDAQLDRLLQKGKLSVQQLDAIADRVARFHVTATKADLQEPYGDPGNVWQPVEENFRQIRNSDPHRDELDILDELELWSRSRFEQLRPVMLRRKKEGFVRECHGDLHLRNIAWFENKPVIFDCIEFSPELRWIDTMSDFAFLFMDLIDRSQPRMAYRLLDLYLMKTGDHGGLALLAFYFVYRALVRAKVDCIRMSQSQLMPAEHATQQQEFNAYLHLAQSFIHLREPVLIITWGLSASGKSTISEQLLQVIGAVRLRSDVERKRLTGIKIESHAAARKDSGIYSADMSNRVYQHLRQLAAGILSAGFPVIVDATFLNSEQRKLFADLATEMHVPFVILQCVASASTLRTRICSRQESVSDANLDILEHQLEHLKPLGAGEIPFCVSVDTEQEIDASQLAARIHHHIEEYDNG